MWVTIGNITIAYQMIAAAIVGIIVTVIYVIWFLNTRTGLIIRAISQNLRRLCLWG